MIKGIILDMGGVIIDLDRERCIESFHALGCNAIDGMLDAYHQRGLFADLETGKISAREFCESIAEYCNPGVTHRQIEDAFLSFCIGVKPYKWELIKELGAKYDLFVLSNNNPIVVPRFEEVGARYGVTCEGSFKECFFSYRMKMVKPCEEFFRTAIARTGLPADEMLFVDDSQTNLDAGAAFGLKTVFYNPEDNLRDVIYNALKQYE